MKLLLTLLAMIVAAPALAADGGGSDGCGLGWQITNKKSMIATTTRGTTNAFVPPTFGMTSGTIGCDQHSFAKNEMPAVNYVATNRDALLMEAAAGGGENLASLSQAMGCSDAAAFAAEAQAQYGAIAASSAEQLYRQMKAVAVAQGCAI